MFDVISSLCDGQNLTMQNIFRTQDFSFSVSLLIIALINCIILCILLLLDRQSGGTNCCSSTEPS